MRVSSSSVSHRQKPGPQSWSRETASSKPKHSEPGSREARGDALREGAEAPADHGGPACPVIFLCEIEALHRQLSPSTASRRSTFSAVKRSLDSLPAAV